jgi:DNA-binding transcriptional ArsR family regulator
MEIKTFSPLDQVDPAVDLGAIQADLADWHYIEDIAANPHPKPAELIAGILHQGCKMILGGTSKSNKSWCLLDMAMSVASGQDWWGRRCIKAPVIYINLELQPWAIDERLALLCHARPECKFDPKMLAIWNLRGKSADMSVLRPRLEKKLAGTKFGLIIIDPAYKVLGDRDENANGEIASLMNEFEELAQSTGAAIVIAHHFAKGDSTAKSAMDRMSGAGVWIRDPDAIMVLTPHEEPDCFTVSSILRNLPHQPEFVVSLDFPLMKVASELNPDALRRPQSKNKVCSDKEFVEAVITSDPKAFKAIASDADSCLKMSKRSVTTYLARLTAAGLICTSAGVYWRAK